MNFSQYPPPVDLLLPLTCQKHLPASRTTPHELEEHCVLYNVFVCLFQLFFCCCSCFPFVVDGVRCAALICEHVQSYGIQPSVHEGLSSFKGIKNAKPGKKRWDTSFCFLSFVDKRKLLKVLGNSHVHSFSMQMSSQTAAHPCRVCFGFTTAANPFRHENWFKRCCVCMCESACLFYCCLTLVSESPLSVAERSKLMYVYCYSHLMMTMVMMIIIIIIHSIP